MIQEGTELVVADNTGAKLAMCFRIIGQRKRYAHIGDSIKVAIKEALPTGAVKKGQVCLAVVVRTGQPIRRPMATCRGGIVPQVPRFVSISPWSSKSPGLV